MAESILQRAHFLERFSCLGADCPDTCCKGWSMQVDDATLLRYESEQPELLDAVATDMSGSFVMRREEGTDACVKLESGLCGIHARLGDRFLGDACHFYPRITRRLGRETLMTATLSCPEIARLALGGEGAMLTAAPVPERLPHTLKNYLAEGLTEEQALAAHRAFLVALDDDSASAPRWMARIASVSRSLTALPAAQWAEAIPFYLKMADMRLPAPEAHPADLFNLLHALVGLVKAANKPISPRLAETIGDMAEMLKVQIDWQQATIQLAPDSAAAAAVLEDVWAEYYSPALQTVLRRWIAAQLSIALFPFGGFGSELADRASVIGVRFATVRLALMAACHKHGALPDEKNTVRIVQAISRVLDHLADPQLSLMIYAETGWLREARLRGILGDA